MNAHCHKIIFSQRLGTLVAVGEQASAQGKSARGEGVRSTVLAAAVLLGGLNSAWSLDASALPSGHQVAAGEVQVSSSGAQMDIQQSSNKAILNWQSFNVGSGAKVNIVQPSSSAALLNRVAGNEMSQIHGQINANGQVVLVNPNGVLVGSSGAITASSFTATTFGITDADFESGNLRFTRNGSSASVSNEGSIHTDGGYVALIGASVSNSGTITTGGGNALLGAGDAVSIPLGSNIRLELDPAAFASVDNSGTITTSGGQVFMRASAVVDAVSKVANATVTHSGTINTGGGRVDVLADSGTVRVSGAVNASGGSVFIGRDEQTNTLAAVGDASGSTLESKDGFVETSGQFLKVDGARVLAKDWLLDPYNITITSGAATGTDYSAWTPIADSTILASDIAANLNAGTSITIATGLSGSAGSSDGNIVVNAAIVKSGSSDATLTLTANNGITINQRIGLAATDTTSSGKLDVVMTAYGDATDALNSQGITLNSVIDANGGQVTLTGTSKNTFGVQTGPTYVYGTTNNTRSGIVFNNGAGITADHYQVTGTHNVAAGNSFGVNGVYLNGTVTFKATGNTDSSITGNSNAQGNFGAGVMVWDGATVRLENQGTGVTTLKGSNTNAEGGNGIRIGASGNTATINAIGRVTLGQQTAGVNAPIFIRGNLSATVNNANLGGLSILGQTGSGLTASAVQIWDANINTAGIDFIVNGVAGNGVGVLIQNAPNTTWTTKNLTVTGVANTTAGSSGSGVVVQRYPNVLTVNASGDIVIQGTVQGAGNGRGLYFAESGWGAQAPALNATGNVTLRGINAASPTNGQQALYIASGVQVTAGGNITLQGETNNAASNAIHLYSAATNSTAWNTAGASALHGNTTLQATGNVLIQSNQGRIWLDNQLSSTLNNGGTPLLTSETKITGRNISIDNTGGTVDAITGVITGGSGTSSSANAGIHIADGRAITALDNINIYGVGTSGHGVNISGAAQLSAGSAGYTGNLNITGINTATSVTAINIGNTSASLTAQNFATLTSGVKASGQSLNVAGQIQVGAELQVENPNAGTISGVISGTGLLRKRGGTGSGTLTLTGNNTYTGGTVANGGTLQVGNGGTTGTLGTGSISVGAVLTINRSDSYTIADNISGVGQLWQVGTGTTVLTGTNSYSGTTAVNAGVLQVGNGGTTGTLGTGNVTLSNTSLVFQRSDNISASNSITGTGNVYATSTGGGVTLSNLTLTGNLSASAAGDIHLTNAGVINFSARTTGNNGDVSLTNTAGTTTVTTVNGISGVSTHGSGDVNLSSTSSNGYGLYLLNNVAALGGDVTLSGTTSSTVTATTALAGVFSSAAVTAKNITLTAQATGTSGQVLGYYGAGGTFDASETLSLTGTSQSTGNGLYSYGGRYTSGTGMTLVGTSAAGQGLNFDANMVVSNGASGHISITGTATNNTLTAIGMRGVTITNGGGDISMVANSGHVIATSGNPAWGLGALSNTITQNGTGDVSITTQNGGNITVPIIVNNGAGDVVVAAGSNLAAGTGTGGQVLTVSGNSITQNSIGKTYIYTGQASGTGQLSHLGSGFNQLYYQGTSQPLNTQFNTTYSNTIAGGATTQVLFRSSAEPTFTLSLNNIQKVYGDTLPSDQSTLNAALLSAYNGSATLTTNVNGADSGANTFAVTAADVINGLNGFNRAAGNNVGTYVYTDVSGSAFNTTVSAQPSLVITPRAITLTSLSAATKVYDGNTVASITGGTFGNIVAGETLAFSGNGYFNSANVNGVSTVTVDDVTALTKAAGGSGLWSNYNLTTTGALTSNTVANQITAAPLIATVNDSAIFVTQAGASAPFMGVSYSGFVGGDTAATALSGSATLQYTGANANPGAGVHTNVLGLSTTPTANHGNYTITVDAGDLTVVAADKLLITIDSQTATYGSQSSVAHGGAASGTISAVYCLDANNCSGNNLFSLTTTRLSNTQWKAEDNTGSYVVFDTGISGATFSGGGYLEVGNYQYTATEIAPLSLFTNGVANFTGRFTNGGVLTIDPLTVNPTLIASDKTYDGTTAVSLSTSVSGLNGDGLSFDHVSASFDTATAGTNKTVSVYGVQLLGADSANYRLASPTLTTFANIFALPTPTPEPQPRPTPEPVPEPTPTPEPQPRPTPEPVPEPTPSPSPFIPVINPSLSNGGGFASGLDSAANDGAMAATLDNPFQLSTDDQGQCHSDNLEACGCDATGPEPGLDICYQRFASSP